MKALNSALRLICRWSHLHQVPMFSCSTSTLCDSIFTVTLFKGIQAFRVSRFSEAAKMIKLRLRFFLQNEAFYLPYPPLDQGTHVFVWKCSICKKDLSYFRHNLA